MGESSTDTAVNHYCLGCLCRSNDHQILDYKIQYAHFRAIFQVASIKLCYLCKRMSQHAELFIQNVQNNQILLENCIGDMCASIQEVQEQLELPITLSPTHLDTINITRIDSNDPEITCSGFKVTSCYPKVTHSDPKVTRNDAKVAHNDANVAHNDAKVAHNNYKVTHNEGKVTHNYSKVTNKASKTILSKESPLISKENIERYNSNIKDILQENSDEKLNKCMENTFNHHNKIKLEIKEEDITLDNLESIDDNDDFQDPKEEIEEVKQEDFSHKALLKKEIQIEDIDAVNLRTKLRKNNVKKRVRPKKIQEKIKKPKVFHYDESTGIETIYITKEQCMEERKQLLLDPKYTNCMYKCEDCIKGFTFKASYEIHMEKHSLTMGAFQCDICKLRMDTEEKLQYHKRYHTIRYKCIECGIIRVCRVSIKNHFTAYHRQGERAYVCPYCSKAFKRQVSKRKHVNYTHLKKERVTCAYCYKSYANKDVLKAHMMVKHPKEVSAPEVVKRYPCMECGVSFKTPSSLKLHGTKHSLKRDFYCVECDKAFKSEAVLKQHLKTAQPHVNYLELPLTCQHCDKRFAIKRNLDRHMNRVHLDIKPFRCDKCDKAYVYDKSLTDHKRLIHEGYRRPLRYPCKLCDKIFDRNCILKAHIRTHTGERPYQCSKCPAQFSQSGVLATHNKLIHLKLTRDGKPKPNSMKYVAL